jgi:hypothetical protein
MSHKIASQMAAQLSPVDVMALAKGGRVVACDPNRLERLEGLNTLREYAAKNLLPPCAKVCRFLQ